MTTPVRLLIVEDDRIIAANTNEATFERAKTTHSCAFISKPFR